MWELLKLLFSNHTGVFSEIMLVAASGIAIVYLGLKANDHYHDSLSLVVVSVAFAFILVVFLPHGYTLFEINYLHADASARSLNAVDFDENQLRLLVQTHFWVALVGCAVGAVLYLKWPNPFDN